MRPTSVVIQAHKHISQLRRRWVEKSSAGWVKRCSRVLARRGPRGRRGCCRTRSYQRNGECWGFSPSTFLSDGCLYCWQLRSFIKLDCCNRYKSLRWLLGGLKWRKGLSFFFFFSTTLLTFSIKYITSVRLLVENWAGTCLMLEFQVVRALLYSGESVIIKEVGWSPLSRVQL